MRKIPQWMVVSPGDAATSNHKSIGKTLTMRRLNLLSNQAFKGTFTMDNLTDAEGTIQGTRVEIRITLE